MATRDVVARRYSKALWQVAGSVEKAAAWLKPLESLSHLLSTSKDLNVLLKSPAYPLEKKWPVLSEILQGIQSPQEVNNFIRYLLKSGRMEVFGQIEEAFKNLVAENSGTLEVQVESALPLVEKQHRQLTEKLEKITGKKITVQVRLAPELLAGLKIYLQGKTFDASLSANLQIMQHELLQAEA